MQTNWQHPYSGIKSAWNPARMVVKGKLTDRQIEKYRKQGFYSAEFRQARRDYMKKKKSAKRVGNFLKSDDGSFIYAPI